MRTARDPHARDLDLTEANGGLRVSDAGLAYVKAAEEEGASQQQVQGAKPLRTTPLNLKYQLFREFGASTVCSS